MPTTSRRARRSVCFGFGIVLLLLGLGPATPSAQQGTSQGPFFVSGRNVNTVGPSAAAAVPGTVAEFGDPLFKQQNEVDCDVSPNDSRLVFCANNDYRGIEAFDDSWIGVTMSDDGGLTWKSRLHPGFPATKGTGVGAADPVVATVPGLGLVGFITISRTDDRGTLRLGRWLERNKENGDRYTHLDTVVIGSGTPGRFADKPAMVAVLTSAGLAGGLTTVGDRTVPNGVIHFGYAIFPGNTNNSSSEIYHLMSTNYGRTWSNPKKLSESIGINQGIDFAVGGSTVVATWRRVKDNNEADAIMFARSTDGGKTWSKASVLSLGTFFDQDSSDLQFRTRSMPSIVYDGTAFHAFWAARRFAANADDARVVVSSSTTDGATWPSPKVVDDYTGRGHQLMPTAAVAGGRVQVNWIDSRNNLPGSHGAMLADIVYDDSTSESGKKVYRQSVDVFAAQAPSGASLGFGGSQQVSRYRKGFATVTLPDKPPSTEYGQLEYNFVNARMFKQGAWPFHGDYHAVAGQRYRPDPSTPGAWLANTRPSDSHAVFYSAFTDNRDVRGYVWASPANSTFTPAGGVVAQGESGSEVYASCDPNPTTPTDAWDPGNSPRSRDQNVYAAATLPGLLVESPSGSKPTGTLGRAYVVTVYNLTDTATNYRLSIANQPDEGSASWERCAEGACVGDSIVSTIDSTITRRSSISRTVYVVSTQPRPRIVVNVVEQAPLAGPTAQAGSVILNADPNAPAIEQPDGNLAAITDYELYQPAILTRQVTSYSTSLLNPDVVPVWNTGTPEAPRIDYPRIDYPRIDYPRIDYPRIDYTAEIPRIDYPRIDYPRIDYQSVENPRIDYSALSGDVTEITWPVTTATANPLTAANTTTAMTAMVFVNGPLPAGAGAQLLVTVPYTTAAANSCVAGDPSTLVDNQVIVNYRVENLATLAATPDGVPDVVNPDPWQPSFPVKPGQTVWVTLRLRGITAEAGKQLARRTGLWVRAQPDTAADNGLDEARDGVVDVTAPVLDLGGVSALASIEGNAPGGANVSVTVTATDDSNAATVTCERTDASGTVVLPADGTSSFIPLGSWTGTCTAVDPSGNQSEPESFPINVRDTTPPTVTVPADIPAMEATGPGGAIVSFSVTASDIVDAAPVVSCAPASGSTFVIGTTTVTCTATDASGNEAQATFTVTVVDTTPPDVVQAATPTVLIWSPNKIMTPVQVYGSITDASTVTAAYTIVDEYGTYSTTGPGIPITVNADGTYSFTVSLEAWRLGGDSDGRTYTITVRAFDSPGNWASKSVTVKVPHNR